MDKLNLEKIIDALFGALLFFIIFISPLKFGIPTIETNKIFLPESALDWIFNPWPNELFIFLIAVLSFMYLIKLAARRKSAEITSPVDVPVIIFIAAVVISAVNSVNKNISIMVSAQIASAVLFFYIILNNPEKKKLILTAFLASASTVAVYGAYQSFFGFSDTKEWASVYMQGDPQLKTIQNKLTSGRVFSTFVYPNAFAGYLLTAIPMAVLIFLTSFKTRLSSIVSRFSCFQESRDISLFTFIISAYMGAFIIIFFEMPAISYKTAALLLADLLLALFYPITQIAGLFLSLSQGGVLVFFIVLLFILCVFDKKIFIKALMYLVIAVLALAIVVLIFNSAEFPRYFKLMSLKVRIEYLLSALNMVQERPVLGFGPGAFGSVYAKFKLLGAEETQFAHNNYIQVFAESGIAAFIGFCLIWILGWIRGLKQIGKEQLGEFDSVVKLGAFLGLSGFLAHSFIDFDFYVPAISLSAFLLLAVIFWGSETQRRFNITGLKRVFLVLTAAVILFAGFFYSYGKLESGLLYKKGLKDFNKGLYPKALQSFISASYIDDTNPMYKFYCGICWGNIGNPREALPYLEKSSALNRFLPYMHYELAACNYLLKNISDAEEHLKEAVLCYPTNIFYRLELAKYYEIVGQKNNALVEYKKIRGIAPEIRDIGKKIESLEK